MDLTGHGLALILAQRGTPDFGRADILPQRVRGSGGRIGIRRHGRGGHQGRGRGGFRCAYGVAGHEERRPDEADKTEPEIVFAL